MLAAKDRVLDSIPDPWPEGPPFVLCRHLYEVADAEQPKGSREWHDARTLEGYGAAILDVVVAAVECRLSA